MKNKVRKGRQDSWNDLLLPILCVLCIMPFCVHLAEYDYGYSTYLWHSEDSVAQDLYAYYRSYFFEVIVVISLCVLTFRMALYKEKNKPAKLFVPLAVYSVFALFSTIFSVNSRASLTGNFYQFQSVFVLTGFCLMCFYTYQVMEQERDYRAIVRGIVAAFVLISITGWFQVFHHDLLNYEAVQRLVMSEEQFALYKGEIADVFSGNNVFLTLYNPNYAAVFLVMTAAVFAALAFGEQEKKKRVGYLVLLLMNLILLWFTYTRAALVALGVTAVIFVICARKSLIKLWKYILPAVFLLAAVLIGADALNDFQYLSRIAETGKEAKLEEIRTSQDGVTITCEGKSLILSIEKENLCVRDESGSSVKVEKSGKEEFLLPFPTPVPAIMLEEEGDLAFMVQVEEQALEFVQTEEGMFYRNEEGKLDEMTDIPKIDMHGLEYLGSGRLYIWSRVFPMLKNYLFVGSGPDTFAEVYPQNDYVGKILYAGTPRRVMEGAHNDYLTRCVQTGMLSVAALLVFYVLLCWKCFSYYKYGELYSMKGRLGFGCFLACTAYLVCCLFSDSTLYTTPMFYIFAGIALAAAEDGRDSSYGEKSKNI